MEEWGRTVRVGRASNLLRQRKGCALETHASPAESDANAFCVLRK